MLAYCESFAAEDNVPGPRRESTLISLKGLGLVSEHGFLTLEVELIDHVEEELTSFVEVLRLVDGMTEAGQVLAFKSGRGHEWFS
jgi:hypothetical protein